MDMLGFDAGTPPPMPTISSGGTELYVDVAASMIAFWPERVCSILVSGPSGSGKSHLVDRCQDKIKHLATHSGQVVKVLPTHFSLSDAVIQHYNDGSTGLRKQLLRHITTDASEYALGTRSPVNRSSADAPTSPMVHPSHHADEVVQLVSLVIMDHTEAFLSHSVGRSAVGGRADPTEAAQDAAGAAAEHCNFAALVTDLYDVIRARPFECDGVDLPRGVSRVVYLLLFSGDARTEMDAFVFRKCFDCHISPGTPSEKERRGFFRSQLQDLLLPDASSLPSCAASSGAADDLSARTGGIQYRGLMEIVDLAHYVFKEELSHSDRCVLTGPPTETCKSQRSALGSWFAQRTVKLFFSSGSQASVDAQQKAGYVDVPETRWSDIAGLESVKQQIKELLMRPLAYLETYHRFGVRPSTGLLLHGPPGTGKTMLARAMATELNASFVYLDLPQLIHSEVGESERRLKEFFDVAKQRSPTVMFIDEVQSAFGQRYEGASGDAASAFRPSTISPHETRLVSLLLSLLDDAHEGFMGSGISQAAGDSGRVNEPSAEGRPEGHFILFVGATNVMHRLDPLLLRPGRLDTHIPVPPPDRTARESLIRNVIEGEWSRWWEAEEPAAARRRALAKEALVHALVDGMEGCSGAEIRNALNLFAMHLLAAQWQSELPTLDVSAGDAEDEHGGELPLLKAFGDVLVDADGGPTEVSDSATSIRFSKQCEEALRRVLPRRL